MPSSLFWSHDSNFTLFSSDDFVLPARLSIVNSNASKTTVEPSEATYSNFIGLDTAYTSKLSIIYKIRKSMNDFTIHKMAYLNQCYLQCSFFYCKKPFQIVSFEVLC